MKKVLIYVEGQTEETFIRDVLGPYLGRLNIYLIPTLARTKRTRSGKTFKGGIVSYKQVRGDILTLLRDASADLVTTMIDYYGLPDDFPGKGSLPSGEPFLRVQYLEDAFAKDIGRPKFQPFLTLHEFEALLFAKPEEISGAFPNARQVDQLIKEVSALHPEEINEGPATHPSARIDKYIPGYRKRLHGPLIVKRIGLETIRERCQHFNDWVLLLEN